MQQTLGAAGRAVGGCKCPTSQISGTSRTLRLPVCAAKQGSSPWSTGPGQSRGSSSSSSKNSSKNSSSKTSKPNSSPKPSKKPSKSSSSSGQGFGPQKPQKLAPLVHKLTPPLTSQLLDELSGWEVVPAPLWGTFTGHCEGEWLGQYSAYTPWGGDPEPVWADASGAYLLYAYSRASETREQVQVDAAAAAAATATATTEQRDTEAAAAAAAAVDTEESDIEVEGVDMLMRRTLRSASISSLIGGTSATRATAAAAELAATGASGGNVAAAAAAPEVAGTESAAAEDDESEGFAYNCDGAVVFNGGSYSIGPELLDAPAVDEDFEFDPEDEEALASYPFSTVLLEQSLVAGGDMRLRLVATLKLRQAPAEQEFDVEPARLLLYKEHWYGTAESTNGLHRKQPQQQQEAASSSSSGAAGGHVLQLLPSHKFDVPMVNFPRPQPQQMAGSWNVFLVAANPIVEENPDTLQNEEVLVYSSREERQQWHVPGLTTSAALGSSIANSSSSSNGAATDSDDMTAAAAAETLDDDGSGGSFWLPCGAVVTIKMVQWPSSSSSSSSSGSASANGNGSGISHSRGLMVGLHWLVDDGSCVFIERQYDGEGQLAEVRHGTAVKGGWSGGRM